MQREESRASYPKLQRRLLMGDIEMTTFGGEHKQISVTITIN